MVPTLALLIVLRQILGLSGLTTWSRMMETLFWLTVVYAGLALVKNMGHLSERSSAAWARNVPILFFVLARAVMLFLVATHVLSGIWGFEVGKVTTAVGIGTMGIALALQDTLSNLVSGFLLLADRPFRIGDWCLINGSWLKVREIGWRTTRFDNMERGIVTIPNGTLGKSEITNYGQEGSLFEWRLEVGFSYEDPPNLVRRVIQDVLDGLDGLEPGSIGIHTVRYDGSQIIYLVVFAIDFNHQLTARTEFLSQLYYAAKRHGLTIPHPTRTVYHRDMATAQASATSPTHHHLATLQGISLFQTLTSETLSELAAEAGIRRYGVGERIVRQGEPDEGIYIIQDGRVTLSAHNRDGEEHPIFHLVPGDVFGEERSQQQGEPSPVTATVTTDAQILFLGSDAVEKLLGEQHQFAMAMNVFVEERQRAIWALLGQEDVELQQSARHELLNLLVSDTTPNGSE